MGPGTDIITFVGQIQQVSITLVNPYSSREFDVDGEFRVNTGAYDGGGGVDFLFFTNDGDFLSIRSNVDNTGIQVVQNIENFFAGEGGDVINLADETLVLGDITIGGGLGDDILFSNAGNDLIFGAAGNDIIDAGPGNDTVEGNDDNDQIFGGEGDDRLDGGAGDDIIFGGTDLGLVDLDREFIDNITFPDLIEGTDIQDLIPPGSPALGINSDNLSVEFGATATLTFREGFAGFNNTLGLYRIAEDGTIENASILFGNVKDAGLNTEIGIDIPVGEGGGQFGFFIIANGDRLNNEYDGLDITAENAIQFIFDLGGVNERAASVNDDGNLVSVVFNDGTDIQVLSGPTYHTTPRGETPIINEDGEIHAVSGLLDANNQDVLRIGFEDLPGLGDADFEDVLFDLNIDRVRVDASEIGADILIGGAGNDVLYGEAGDDILVFGDGGDQVFGGSGSDILAFDLADTLVDQIFGFESGAGGDVLNVTDVLEGFDPLSDALSDFVQLVQNGNDTEFQLNADGDAGGAFATVAVFDGGLADTLADLITNGNIVADQSVVL